MLAIEKGCSGKGAAFFAAFAEHICRYYFTHKTPYSQF